ncbi:MAG: DUF4157 domain-containing protein [Deltaproteobacteria bacterium]|nr:DUF4157 domain-containing protein [Deltaproteobacteria bacterium]
MARNLTDRLLSRNTGAGLSRRAMPDGGEVLAGPLARRALRAVGARAMTMDHSVLVDDTFDVSRSEDLALYAHERHHLQEGAGHEIHSASTTEEAAARSVERMVLHRREAGEDVSAILADAAAGRVTAAARTALAGVPDNNGGAAPWAGYMAMRSEGLGHHQIVRELADSVLKEHKKAQEGNRARTGGHG